MGPFYFVASLRQSVLSENQCLSSVFISYEFAGISRHPLIKQRAEYREPFSLLQPRVHMKGTAAQLAAGRHGETEREEHKYENKQTITKKPHYSRKH